MSKTREDGSKPRLSVPQHLHEAVLMVLEARGIAYEDAAVIVLRMSGKGRSVEEIAHTLRLKGERIGERGGL